MMSDSKVGFAATLVATASNVMSQKIHQVQDMELFPCLYLSHVMARDLWELQVVESLAALTGHKIADC